MNSAAFGGPYGTATAFCDELFAFITVAGQSRYDETVTQLEHGLQAAALAEAANCDEAAQIPALLHDIGHLLLDEHTFPTRDLRPETAAPPFLTPCSDPTPCTPAPP